MQIFAFLSVTTTNVLATNSPQAPGISDRERKRRMGWSETMLAYTLCIALVMGLCIVLCLETFGPWLLILIGINDEILAPATQYLRIRATASPAVMLVTVAQGACFGQQVNPTHSIFVVMMLSFPIPGVNTVPSSSYNTHYRIRDDAHLLHGLTSCKQLRSACPCLTTIKPSSMDFHMRCYSRLRLNLSDFYAHFSHIN